jgi:hypothetical protein
MREEIWETARQRAGRPDNVMHTRRERQHAGESHIAEGGCNDVYVGFATQRPQCRGERSVGKEGFMADTPCRESSDS